MKIYTELPVGKLECPVCNGTGRKPAGKTTKYKNVIAGYDPVDDTVGCNNCGGQRMFGTSLGYVSANKDGLPCTHHYKAQNVGNCLTKYTCEHCGAYHTIDSGG